VQYTRNMVTGASISDLAVVLVDARNGVVEQTRRHAAVASLLLVPQLVLARAVVIAHTPPGGSAAQLVAYVVPADPGDPPVPDEPASARRCPLSR
jgi:sulfate adenylyltransferase subunit 1